jgi:extracellular factor (EF) 3-hydroxypalmitic acid methyl ester biosynthesis protein
MDEAAIKESRVICKNSQGLKISGTIIQLGRHEVVFEVYSPIAVIQMSEVLREFKIELRNQPAYSGRAVVKNLVHTELKVVCAAALDEGWQLQFSTEELQPGQMPALFKEHLRQCQKLYLVRSEYKLQIADMENFFAELRQWLDQVELGLRTAPSGNGRKLEDEVVQKLGASILPCIDALFEKFEHLAEELEPAVRPVHRVYMQRRLHPLLLCAPFAHRTFTKPLGFAGDYEMVGMIARNSPEGGSLFAKIINLWFVRQAPAAAHRNRIQHLTQRLVEETLRAGRPGRPARIFSLACGPAVEVLNFVREHEISNRAELTLLDFDEETLQQVTGALTDLKARLSRRTPVHFIKRSVHNLLKESGRTAVRSGSQQYDFVYCAGLFDYLTDAVCQRLMTLLYDWVAPGGLLLATNVEPSNPMRHGMEHLLDWHLIYRKCSQLQKLRPTQVAPEDFVVRADMTGVNLFMEARKPKDG